MIKNVTYLIAAFMVIMCYIFASFLLFTDLIAETMYGTKRTILICLLFAYGTYRAYRIYSSIQADKRRNK